MQKRELARAVAFLLIAAILFQILTVIFVPKWYGTWQSTRIVDGFYELPEDSLDVVLMGSSQTIMGLSPEELFEDYGIASYSFGTEEQPIYATYYWLKEILRFHTPKVVVVDINEVLHPCNEAAYRKAFDYMKWSNVKWDAVRTHCEGDDSLSLLSYLLPFTNYHSRWDELEEADFTYFTSDKTDPYFGFVISSGTCDSAYIGVDDADKTIKPDPVDLDAYHYLVKIAELCQQENMELLFVKTPRAGWNTQKNALISFLAFENQIPYIDFNEKSVMKEMGFDYKADARDASHLNIYGAEKVADYLGAYLTEHYDLPDRSQDPAYSLWADMLPVYHLQTEEAKLLNTTNLSDWLALVKPHQTLFLSVSDGYLLQSISDEIYAQMETLGINVFALKSGADYAAVVENGATVREVAALGIGDFSGTISDETYYEISVTNPEVEEEGLLSVCSIRVDHTEYAVEGEGLHIAVYDPVDQEMIDSILVDSSVSTYPISR